MCFVRFLLHFSWFLMRFGRYLVYFDGIGVYNILSTPSPAPSPVRRLTDMVTTSVISVNDLRENCQLHCVQLHLTKSRRYYAVMSC